MEQQPEQLPHCCICLSDHDEIAEWKVLECGGESEEGFHRICMVCYNNMDEFTDHTRHCNYTDDSGDGLGEEYAAIPVIECPICRTHQLPTRNGLMERIPQQQRHLNRLRTDIRIVQRNQAETIRENGRLRNMIAARPAGQQYAAGGGGAGGGQSIYPSVYLPFQINDNQHAARLTIQHGNAEVEGSWANTLEMGQSFNVRQAYRAEREVMVIEQLRNAAEGVEADALHAAWVTQSEVAGNAHAALTAREAAYITLFAPNWEQLEEQRILLEAEAQQNQEAEAARVAARQQVWAAAHQQQVGVERVARVNRLVENVGLRRDRLVIDGRWGEQRETCWIKLNGGVCETPQKTRRECSVAGCDKKVCRRCDTCGDH